MTRRNLALAALGALFLALGGCNPFPATCRRRLTLVLDTPLGPRTGSSVIQVTAYEQGHFIAHSKPFKLVVRGQAVVIPVGNDVVFGVLEEHTASILIRSSRLNDPSSEDLLAKIRQVSGKASYEPTYDLPKEEWPSLVRFADRSAPESVQPVCLNLPPWRQENEDPSGPCSIRIVRATVTPTKDRVTTGVLDHLPWLKTRHGSLVQGRWDNELRQEQLYTNQAFLPS